ncbi:MAG: fucose isomerase [Firmicutes bacterium]|nr:fucose isomerase [Bacillota bacterium]
MKPRIGLISFGEKRTEVYEKRKQILEEEICRTLEILRSIFDLQEFPDLVRFEEQTPTVISWAASYRLSGVVLHLPVYSASALIQTVGNELAARGIPLLLLTNGRPDTSGLVVLLAAGGALDQVGVSHTRILAEPGSVETTQQLTAWATAVQTRARLRTQVLGSFGGRSIGIATTTTDPAQVKKLFGVDIEHVDQMEIVKAAKTVDAATVQNHVNWLISQVGKVEYDGTYVTDAKLDLQMRSYLATKHLLSCLGFDFIGVKCQPELSDGFCIQCLSHALLNDTYDADGSKPTTVCACENDLDGAITMQILKLISGGLPVNMMDTRQIDPESKTFIFANCGGMPTFFAGSGDALQNLKNVHLVSNMVGKAGGAATQFVCAAYPEVTFARLCRHDGRYWMAVLLGQFERRPREILQNTTYSFPHAFARLEMDYQGFVRSFGANHIHAVYGNYVRELEILCQLWGIEMQTYGTVKAGV